MYAAASNASEKLGFTAVPSLGSRRPTAACGPRSSVQIYKSIHITHTRGRSDNDYQNMSSFAHAMQIFPIFYSHDCTHTLNVLSIKEFINDNYIFVIVTLYHVCVTCGRKVWLKQKIKNAKLDGDKSPFFSDILSIATYNNIQLRRIT